MIRHTVNRRDQPENDRDAILTQDRESFETLHRRITLLEGIALGEKAIEEGRSLTQNEAKKRMSRWLK